MIDSTTAVVPLPPAAYAAIPTGLMLLTGMVVRRRFA
jgi:hypothetical protein